MWQGTFQTLVGGESGILVFNYAAQFDIETLIKPLRTSYNMIFLTAYKCLE